MSKSTPTKPRIPFAPQPQYDVVWNGASTTYGEKGQLLPETHTASSTWSASVEKLWRKVEAANAKQVEDA